MPNETTAGDREREADRDNLIRGLGQQRTRLVNQIRSLTRAIDGHVKAGAVNGAPVSAQELTASRELRVAVAQLERVQTHLSDLTLGTAAERLTALARARWPNVTPAQLGLGAYSWAGWKVAEILTAHGYRWAVVSSDPTEAVGLLLGSTEDAARTEIERFGRARF